MKASIEDEALLKQHGYTVERWGDDGGFVLFDTDGAGLQIEGYGGIAPTRWEAVAEGLRRIRTDARPTTEDALRRLITVCQRFDGLDGGAVYLSYWYTDEFRAALTNAEETLGITRPA